MAKKKSRQTIRRAPAQSIAPSTEEVRPTSRQADLSVEYHYVIRDLRQIALIAASLIAGLVVLSYLI